MASNTDSPPKSQLNVPLRQAKILKTASHPHLPIPTGPLTVGYRDLMLGNSRNTGLLLRLFYPTSSKLSDDPQSWPKWLYHENYEQGMLDLAGVRSRLLTGVAKAINRRMGQMRTPAVENGPLLRPSRKWPVIVFSHGVGGYRFMYSTFCMEFASRGFVVAAVEHRDNSAGISFYFRQPDTSPELDVENERTYEPEIPVANYKPPRRLPSIVLPNGQELVWIRYVNIEILDHSDNVGAFRHRQVVHRAGECSRAVDLLECLNSGSKFEDVFDSKYSGEEFINCLDLEKISIVGHSFGGATALFSALQDARFKAVVTFDAWAFPLKYVSLHSIAQPVLFVNAETLGTWTENVAKYKEIFKGADPKLKQAIIVQDSTHIQQSDVPFVISKLMLRIAGRDNPLVDTFDVHDLSSAQALAFIGKHLEIEIDNDIGVFLAANEGLFRPTYEF